MFAVVHYQNGLSVALIFSSSLTLVFLRQNIFFFGTGLGFFYELNVIFERFANILNIKNIQMIKIDPI